MKLLLSPQKAEEIRLKNLKSKDNTQGEPRHE